MVDNINKISDNLYRVHEARDSADDEDQKRNTQDDDDGDQDNFNKLSDKTNWKVLFDKTNLWNRNVEVKVEDIDRIKLMGLNFRTNPALLKLRVFLFDGSTINTAFISVSRSLALELKSKQGTSIDVNKLTTENSLWLTLPTDETALDDEITRITEEQPERTFSEAVKMIISGKSLLQKIGLQDPVSKRTNYEILWIYLTVCSVVTVLVFTILFLRFS